MEVPITGLMNDRYAAKTSNDIRRTFDIKRRKGEFIGAFAPYGYKKKPENKNHLIIDEEAAQIVRNIYHWFVYDGMWSLSTVFRILQNEVYIGTMIQGKQRVISYKVHDKITQPKEEWYVVENTHEPIIDQVTFEKAQNLSRRDTRTAPSKKRVYLFSGFLRWPDCNIGMARKSSKRKTKAGVKEYTYYVCSTYAIKNKCTRHSIKVDDLTEAILKTLH